MPGRDRKLVKSKGYKEVNDTPNYDITRQHIPVYLNILLFILNLKNI